MSFTSNLCASTTDIEQKRWNLRKSKKKLVNSTYIFRYLVFDLNIVECWMADSIFHMDTYIGLAGIYVCCPAFCVQCPIKANFTLSTNQWGEIRDYKIYKYLRLVFKVAGLLEIFDRIWCVKTNRKWIDRWWENRSVRFANLVAKCCRAKVIILGFHSAF